MAGPEQFGRLNMWGMMKALLNNNISMFPFSGTPVSGASGTFAGKAGIGSALIDTTTGIQYTNTGTQAAPQWSADSSPVIGTAGLGVIGNAKMTYDFAISGGVQGAIIPPTSPTIPINAVILGGVIDVTTQLTSGGSATIALGTSAGSSAASLIAATAVASWTTGTGLVVIPKFTAATWLKLTAAGRPNLTIATADLTAGKFDINLVYIIGN